MSSAAAFQTALRDVVRKKPPVLEGRPVAIVRPIELASSSLYSIEVSFNSFRDAGDFLDSEDAGRWLKQLVELGDDEAQPLATILFDVTSADALDG
jgi:hypothetical protein